MFDANEFLNDILKDVNLPEDQKQILQSTVSNPSVAQRLEEGYLRQSDYSRKVAEAQRQINLSTNYYNELKQWANGSGYQGNNPTPNGAGKGGDPEYLPASFKDQYQQDIQSMQAGAIGLSAAMTKLGLQYLKEFGDVLDVDAVVKKATEENTNFQIAYERYVQPKRDAKQLAELEERIKRERAEAAQEALANASIPTQQNTFAIPGANPHVVDLMNNPGERKFGWRAAAEAHTRDAMAGNVKQ